MSTIRQSIKELAYDYWLARNHPLGTPQQDWFRSEQMIDTPYTRELAHRLWIERGRPTGSSLVDWLAAEPMINRVGETLHVSARSYWCETPIIMDTSRQMSIRVDVGATDGWTANPHWGYRVYGDGAPTFGFWEERTAKSGYALPHYREGCLVGKIGVNGRPFYIGNECTLPQQAGTLYLTCNDDVDRQYGAGYDDNEGDLAVNFIEGPLPTSPVITGADTQFVLLNQSGAPRFIYSSSTVAGGCTYVATVAANGIWEAQIPYNGYLHVQAKTKLSDTFNAVAYECWLVGTGLQVVTDSIIG